jgi:hypothetical protein
VKATTAIPNPGNKLRNLVNETILSQPTARKQRTGAVRVYIARFEKIGDCSDRRGREEGLMIKDRKRSWGEEGSDLLFAKLPALPKGLKNTK